MNSLEFLAFVFDLLVLVGALTQRELTRFVPERVVAAAG